MMKRNTLTYWVCTLLLSVCALPCLAQNRIEMYTYFPVPYVAYNNIFMVGTADEPAKFQVGFTNNFALNLGSENKPSLTAHTVTLKSPNTLTFDTDVYTGTATFGTANTEGDAPYDAAELTFNNNLRVRQLTETVNNGPDEAHNKVVEKITANDKVTVKGRVAMNTSAFTSADAAKLPDCSDGDKKVRWSKLKFNDQEHYFLTCGYTGSEPDPDPNSCGEGNRIKWERSTAALEVECTITDDPDEWCAYVEHFPGIEQLLTDSHCSFGNVLNGTADYYAIGAQDCQTMPTDRVGATCIYFDGERNHIRCCDEGGGTPPGCEVGPKDEYWTLNTGQQGGNGLQLWETICVND